MALLLKTQKQESKFDLKPSNSKIHAVANKIIEGLKAQGDNVAKLGIEVNEVSLVLANQIREKGVEDGIRDTCHFFGLNDEGVMSTNAVIGMGIALIVMSYIIPMAFTNFYSADTSTWVKNGTPDTMTINLWFLIPAFVVIGLVVVFIKSRG